MPLIRTYAILCKNEGCYYLLIDIHHIIADGQSVSIILSDIVNYYLTGSVKSNEYQFIDYVNYQKSVQWQIQFQQQELFWLELFKNAKLNTTLPVDYKRAEIQQFAGRNIDFKLNEVDFEFIKTLARDNKTSNFTVFYSIFNLALSLASNEKEIVCGIPVFCRREKEFANTVGMFVNTLAIPVCINYENTFCEYLLHVNKLIINCLDNQEYSFESLVNKVVKNKSFGMNPIFNTMFSYQDKHSMKFENQNLIKKTLDVKFLSINEKISKFDFTFTVSEKNPGVEIRVNYCTNLYKRDKIENFIKLFRIVISSIKINKNVVIKNLRN